MSYSYESRRSGPSRLVMAALGFAVGINLSNLVHSFDDHSTKTAQLENQQVSQRLHQQFSEVSQLVLSDGENSFSFQTEDAQAHPETCNGQYEVSHNMITSIGKLSCTQSVPITK